MKPTYKIRRPAFKAMLEENERKKPKISLKQIFKDSKCPKGKKKCNCKKS